MMVEIDEDNRSTVQADSPCVETSEPSSSSSSSVLHLEEERDEKAEIEKMVKNESMHVRLWRRNVLGLLIATSAVVSGLVYHFLKKADVDNFETSFGLFALAIKGSTEFYLRTVAETTTGLSDILTSQANKTGSTWPFVTLSSFEVLVGHSREQASSELIVMCPFVDKDTLPEWADYSREHQSWIDDGFESGNYHGRYDLNPIPSQVYRIGRSKGKVVLKAEDGYGPYPTAPFWQMSPPPFDTRSVNFNALSLKEYQESFRAMQTSRRAVIGRAGINRLIDATISQSDHDKMHASAVSDQGGTAKEPGFADDHPHSNMIVPVFEQLKTPSSRLVAMVVTVLPWDNYLKNLLPEGVSGVYCVLRNTCGQEFTYVINGNEAIYLGEGDLHDNEYSKYEFQIHLEELMLGKGVGVNGNDTATTTMGDCKYWFSVYPSTEFQSSYETNAPFIFSLCVAGTFVVMIITFLVYDWTVLRKNRRIISAAARSNALVSSLFPSTVRDRLLKQADEKKKPEPTKEVAFRAAPELKSFLDMRDGESDDELFSSKPIADTFPETTIMFADLVGFTSWSSTRDPTDVFLLLETLFHEMDKIAKNRRVYKVETVGDCYVAVSGCPEPRKNHAAVMCRFAYDCSYVAREVFTLLEPTLGAGTRDLDMRFGLHSGSITGGVLRGERSRFQLFGDTMNTAARMESNGKPGRIHLSHETASLLIKAGKEHWVEKREDKIRAKGKGEMQTYWLKLSGGSGGSSNGISDEQTLFTESSGTTNNKSLHGDPQVPEKDTTLLNTGNSTRSWMSLGGDSVQDDEEGHE